MKRSVKILSMLIVFVGLVPVLNRLYMNELKKTAILALPPGLTDTELIRYEQELLAGSSLDSIFDALEDQYTFYPNNNPKKICSLWEISAENGNARAQRTLAKGFYEGFICSEMKNAIRAKFWCDKLVNTKEQCDIPAELNIKFNLNEKNFPKKPISVNAENFEETKKLAWLGSPIAAVSLYRFYSQMPKDKAEMQLYWARIYAQNSPKEGGRILYKLLVESNQKEDKTRSEFWLKQSAENGNPQ